MMFSRGSVVTPLVRPEKNLDPTREGSMFGEASSKPCSSSLCLRDFILLSGILASEGWQRWVRGWPHVWISRCTQHGDSATKSCTVSISQLLRGPESLWIWVYVSFWKLYVKMVEIELTRGYHCK